MTKTIFTAANFLIKNTAINSTFNTTLDRKIDDKSLLTYGATQAAISTLWNSVGHNLVNNAIRPTFYDVYGRVPPDQYKLCNLTVNFANLIISSAIGTVVGKYMTDACSKKPMTWNQAINTTILNSATRLGLITIDTYKN